MNTLIETETANREAMLAVENKTYEPTLEEREWRATWSYPDADPDMDAEAALASLDPEDVEDAFEVRSLDDTTVVKRVWVKWARRWLYLYCVQDCAPDGSGHYVEDAEWADNFSVWKEEEPDGFDEADREDLTTAQV